MTETKNLLTRAECRQILLKQTKAAVGSNWMMLPGVLLITVPMIGIGIYIGTWSLALGLFFAAIFLLPLVGWGIQMVKDIRTMRITEGDGFSIVEDDVCRMAAGEPEGRSTVDVIYFTVYGRYVPSSAVFSLTSVNDRFYLVILQTKKPRLLLAFSSKMYRCGDLG